MPCSAIGARTATAGSRPSCARRRVTTWACGRWRRRSPHGRWRQAHVDAASEQRGRLRYHVRSLIQRRVGEILEGGAPSLYERPLAEIYRAIVEQLGSDSGRKAALSAKAGSRRVLVTGAASGIGLETSLQLARRGDHVVVADRNVAGGEAAVQPHRRCRRQRGVPRARPGGSRSHPGFRRRRAGAGAPLDVLVNNAGLLPPLCARRRGTGSS